MLGKLIKHEWISIYKVGCIILLSALLITVIGCVSMWIPMAIGQENVWFGPYAVVSVLGFMVLFFGLAGISYGIVIFLGVRFYKSMYGEEGYLAHTLPVTSHQLLLSKVLVGGIWMLITVLAVSLAAIVMITFLVGMITGQEYRELLREFARLMGNTLDKDAILFLVYYILVLVIAPFAAISTLYGSITLGQLFSKHRGIMAIICCIIVQFVSGLINMIVSIPFMIGSVREEMMYGTAVVTQSSGPVWQYYINLGVTTIIAVVLYFVAHHIDSRKLNME